ncbi:MAG: photosystem II cytochrome PsbV2 [Oscillatoriales cyanobacterium RM1_1_9]|nr:photosystem II cytochrome PsbV2 [Oscillatoriales cyanobacterium SM2_3_0]NJO44698.1 photosystem II cytochrome PsbV2 [Oscillatoriales cyanobacterium RM2_1_1]NJO70709.1 photosystem II cytochrome PsbV2 [Oscillatoriales cyanobacterium RM1_1_9]
MLRQTFCCLLSLILFILTSSLWETPVLAEGIDPSVRRYLASEPVEVKTNLQGKTQVFTPEELTSGKALFDQNCLNCHARGRTIPYPQVPLSLAALQGATPPRDNIENLVAYFRYPMSYDGSDSNYWCREVPESWMNQEQAEQMAAYLIRAAETYPKWGQDIETNPFAM